MSHDLSGLRLEYAAQGLHESDVEKQPVRQFERWFQEAVNLDINLANAMVLATADSKGVPTARYVLLKEFDESGFVFYTNSLSHKGRQLAENPQAALVFYWKEVHRQVRIEGTVEILPPEKADNYFESRPRGSQISAWVAPQSDVIRDREDLKRREADLQEEFSGKPVPRPGTWVGYRVRPRLMEFWQGQENRLHDRIQYRLDAVAGDWHISRLAP